MMWKWPRPRTSGTWRTTTRGLRCAGPVLQAPPQAHNTPQDRNHRAMRGTDEPPHQIYPWCAALARQRLLRRVCGHRQLSGARRPVARAFRVITAGLAVHHLGRARPAAPTHPPAAPPTVNPARPWWHLALLLAVSTAHAGRQTTLRSPEPGVLCDRHLCANDQGISRPLTEKHRGPQPTTKLFSPSRAQPVLAGRLRPDRVQLRQRRFLRRERAAMPQPSVLRRRWPAQRGREQEIHPAAVWPMNCRLASGWPQADPTVAPAMAVGITHDVV